MLTINTNKPYKIFAEVLEQGALGAQLRWWVQTKSPPPTQTKKKNTYGVQAGRIFVIF